MFDDRMDAARRLAGRLSSVKGQHPLVLAIPRGAVPMAAHIAQILDGELDVVLVRKLGAPGNPEYAIGAVDESGAVWINPDTASCLDSSDLEREVAHQRGVLDARRRIYGPARNPAGRIVIVVDDGVATGSTLIAALRAVRRHQPRRLIAAIGVAPPETIARLSGYADEIVCLEMPPWFGSVGEFYRDFAQVEDTEVVRLLEECRAGAASSRQSQG
jgi:predicted phosphoribosyltransferase